MMTPSRRRIGGALSIGILLFMATLIALISPATAGTQANPEITDAAADQALLGTVPIAEAGFFSADLLAGWVAADDADFIELAILINNAEFGSGSANGVPTTFYHYHFNFSIDDTEYRASASVVTPPGDVQPVPGGVASSASVDGPVLTMVVPKTEFGSPTAGTVMTGLHIVSEVTANELPIVIVEDRGPDEGAGDDYTLVGGEGGGEECDVDGEVDSDCDGLPDAWEQDYFGDLNESASGDPDDDGLTNAGEYQQGTDPTNPDTDGDGLSDGDEVNQHGTNPNNADTDGDGFSDGEEVEAGTDPLDPNDFPGSDGDDGGDGGDGGDADSDNDGLPDAWEQEHFGDLDETATGDPDNDGCDNQCEFGNGTDPNNPDTDGDGISDGDEINIHGTDPNDSDSDNDGISDGDEIAAGSDPNDSTSRPSTDDDGTEFMDKLDAGMGYLLTSAGAMLVVIVLGIIALAGRWN